MTEIAGQRLNFRWLRFSLRSLLVAVTLVAIALCWLRVQVRKAQRHNAVAKEIQESGGKIGFLSYHDRDTSVPSWMRSVFSDYAVRDVNVEFNGMDVSDSVLARMRGMNCVRILLSGKKIDDTGLQPLEGMTNLRWLHLDNTAISDAGLEHLSGLTRLERLFLHDTQITDSGLENLQGMTRMKWLTLGNTQISDDGLKCLRRMESLAFLDLGNTQITDSGLVHLEGICNLGTVNLQGTKVTQTGVDALHAALPNCVFDPPPSQ